MTAPIHWFRIRFSLHLLLVAAGVVFLWTLSQPVATVQAGAGRHENPEGQAMTGHGEFLDSQAVDLLIGTSQPGGRRPMLTSQDVEKLAPIVEAWEPEGYDPMLTWNEPEVAGPESEPLSDTDLLDLFDEETTPKSASKDASGTSPDHLEAQPEMPATDTRLE